MSTADARAAQAQRIAEIEARVGKATRTDLPDVQLSRYEHGGGRMFVTGDMDRTRNLIADFYEEGDREFYMHAQPDVAYLLSALRAAEASAKEECESLHEVLAMSYRLRAVDAAQHLDAEQALTDQLRAAEQERETLRALAAKWRDPHWQRSEFNADASLAEDALVECAHELLAVLDAEREPTREVNVVRAYGFYAATLPIAAPDARLYTREEVLSLGVDETELDALDPKPQP